MVTTIAASNISNCLAPNFSRNNITNESIPVASHRISGRIVLTDTSGALDHFFTTESCASLQHFEAIPGLARGEYYKRSPELQNGWRGSLGFRFFAALVASVSGSNFLPGLRFHTFTCYLAALECAGSPFVCCYSWCWMFLIPSIMIFHLFCNQGMPLTLQVCLVSLFLATVHQAQGSHK
jgi:hypothetical protein